MPDQSDPLQLLIADILEAEFRGEPVDRDSFVSQHPEHADSLREFFANHDSMKAGSHTEDATLPPSSSGPVEDATLPPSTNRLDDATLPPRAEDATLPPSDAPAQPSASVGDKVRYFGDYELLEEIARGGMGVVYKARQINLNRIVALKMILAGQLAGEDDVKRFYTEAEAAASLDHPGIVPIFEVGQHQGQHYFSMGFIEGQSLAQKVADGPLPPREAAELVKKICEAMAYAHERGVIHRDLKPANILIDQNGQPKVTDFGLAKQMNVDSGLTGTGQILGTPSYMAPEQASGKVNKVGPLADVYALGAILYCLLTGRPPFQAANPMDTLLQVLDKEPIAPRQLNPALNLDLQTMTLKCLQKDPGKRYSSAKEFGAEIQRFLGGKPILARPVSRSEATWRWCKRKPVMAALIAASIVSLFTGSVVSTVFAVIAQRHARLAIDEKEETEAALARSNYWLATTRWDSNRVSEANALLESIPSRYRNVEWRLSKRQFQGSDLTYYGHKYFVTNATFSPDGTRVASACADGTIKIWDAVTGAEKLTLTYVGRESNNGVESISFSPDGARLVSASRSTEIKIWDLSTGTLLRELPGTSQSGVSWSVDGTRLAWGDFNGTVNVVDFNTGARIFSVRGLTDTRVIFSPVGSQISYGTGDAVMILDAKTGKSLQRLKGHLGSVTSVSFSPDGKLLASASEDGEIKIWDAVSGEEIRTVAGHTDHVTSLSFSPDGTRIASGSSDRTIKLWDADSGDELRTLTGHAQRVTSVSFSPDGTRLVSGSYDETSKIWNVATGLDLMLDDSDGPRKIWVDFATGPELRMLTGSIDFNETGRGNDSGAVIGYKVGTASVSFCPDGRRLVSGDLDRTIRIWDSSTGAELLKIVGHSGAVNSVSFSPNGAKIVSGSDDKKIKLWDAATGAELGTLAGHSGAVNSVSFSPDGAKIVSASDDRTIKFWDATTGAELGTLAGHSGAVNSVSFSPDGARIVSGSRSTIKLWDAQSGAELWTLDVHFQNFHSVCFSPDSARVASASSDQTIKIWDSATGAELRTFTGHMGEVYWVSFSSDGSRLASASLDGTIKVWESTTGAELTTLSYPSFFFRCIRFSPDGTRLAAASNHKAILVWDAPLESEARMLTGHTEPVQTMSFSLDSTLLSSQSENGELRVWDTASGDAIEDPIEDTVGWNASDGAQTLAGGTVWRAVHSITSPNGRWMAVNSGYDILLVDLAFKDTPGEKAYRKFKALPKPQWHSAQIEAAVENENWFAAVEHFKNIPNESRSATDWELAGASHVRLGEYAVAEVELETALAMRESQPKATSVAAWFLAQTWYQLGNGEQAKALYYQLIAELKTVEEPTEKIKRLQLETAHLLGEESVEAQLAETNNTDIDDDEAAIDEKKALQQSLSNLKKVGLAMHRYHDAYGHFPPAAIYGSDGKSWHSWRVLLLPYMEEDTLYEQYRFDEPWDGTHNRALIEKMPGVYRDPIYVDTNDGYTHYAVAVGAGTAFPLQEAKVPGKPEQQLADVGGTQFSQFIDGSSNSILVGGVSPDLKIPWTKPEDVNFGEDFPGLGQGKGFAAPYLLGSKSGCPFLFADGSTRTVSADIDTVTLRNLVQINDRQIIRQIPTLDAAK